MITEDYKEEYELGSIVTAKRTYNGEIITGEFGGFHLLNKSNPKSIAGVVHTPNGSYDVEPNSIESVISEDDRIRKELIEFVKSRGGFKQEYIAWLEKQGEQKSVWSDNDERNSTEIQCLISYYRTGDDEHKLCSWIDNLKERVRPQSKQEWSEEDEKIRKVLIKLINGITIWNYYLGISKGQMIAWLEKRGEQKPTDKVEPEPYFYCKYGGTTPLCSNCKRNHSNSSFKTEEITTWYVPSKGTKHCIDYIVLSEKQCEQTSADKVEHKFKVGDWVVWNNHIILHIDNIYHEENTLMYTINANGVTWVDCIKDFDAIAHLWTIQDAKDCDVLVASDGSIFIFKEIVDCGCKHYIALEKDGETIDVNVNLERSWESVRGVNPSTREQRALLFSKMKEAGYEWDVEKKELKKIEPKPEFCHHEVDLSNCSAEYRKAYYDGWNNCNQQHAQLATEQKSAWSEEDEKMFSGLISIVVDWNNSMSEKEKEYYGDCGYIDWLNSLKERIAQSYWKPTEEQLTALNNAIEWCVDTDEDKPLLISLYKALKKN